MPRGTLSGFRWNPGRTIGAEMSEVEPAGTGTPEPGTEESIETFRALLATLGIDPDAPPETVDNIARLAADMVIDRNAHLSFDQLLEALGHPDPQRVLDMFTAMDIVVPSHDLELFDDDDVGILQLLLSAPSRWIREGEIHETLRVAGRALATMAEAGLGVHVRQVEGRVLTAAESVAVTVEMTEFFMELGRHLQAPFRHHVHQAIDRQRRSWGGSQHAEVVDMTIAFVDMTGFTELSLALDAHGLAELVTTIDSRASTICGRHGVRLVKLIGDEVMMAGSDVADTSRAALEMIGEFGSEGLEAHGAAVHGEVLMVQGDYYGPTVNLAARLVSVAGPGELVGDRSLCALAPSPDFTVEPRGARVVRGFPGEIEVFALTGRT